MKTCDAIAFFGNATATAEAAGISPSAVSQWGDLVPPATAAILEKLTNGALIFDPSAYRKRNGRLWALAKEGNCHAKPALSMGQEAAA
ncbi:DNA-binding transcriptional regulator for DicB; Qin prophage [Candidatus Competibacter denitrificans Run_A_D11]|uniref:DNA-binding transcriptional regulator for DicB Qin prophage n=1 Tax=Candidatus Competibacter denitrificans Run_A_D11 TaxID=1400863 RepID=W6M478_9GAMM|nr:Cro/CI family transcriptional regulator [Candidatus Competibacter denitrificans]CDI02492.1 DNA-binding transcriptional regulator for DicB; Qin prophage [Candidatus Competibacter denitrificans Run_A_D11]HAS86482.1 hypothetical protein [Candidatus Competibacteraceae bacterium]HRC70485.1 Cro/CI family transcriptional regulator [Candidatus Competibacter denitrificans]